MPRKITGIGAPKAAVMVVGESPGEDDVRTGRPFTGWAGGKLEEWLRSIGLRKDQVYLTNVAKYRPYGGDTNSMIAKTRAQKTEDHVLVNGLWVDPVLAEGVKELKEEINKIKPNIIVALGNIALWALTGNTGIEQWRGSLCQFQGIKIIPTISPIGVVRQLEWNPIVLEDFKRIKREMVSKEMPEIVENFLVSPSFEEATSRLLKISSELSLGEVKLAVDIETKAGQIDMLGIATSSEDAMCIPFIEGMESYWSEEEEVAIMLRLREILCHKNAYIIGQNYAYDAVFIRQKWMYWTKCDFDTMIAHHSLVPSGGSILTETDKGKKGGAGAIKKNLGFLSSLYCKNHVYWKDDLASDDFRVRQVYNCRDCIRTFEIADKENKLVAIRHPKQKYVSDFQQSLFWPVRHMEARGFRIDTRRRAELKEELVGAIASRTEWIEKVLGHPINLNSPLQMKSLFYTDFAMDPIKKRSGKKMTITCDGSALAQLAEKEPLIKPIVTAIEEIRSMGVFLNTFLEAPLDQYGRLRTSFDITGTKTFRFSHSQNQFGEGTNLGNVPKGGPIDQENPHSLCMPNIRSLCIPDEGCTIFDTDLDSADLRTVAWEADSDELRAMFDAGLKPYVEIAKEFHRDPTITKSHPAYGIFKSLCHGTNYLGQASELARRLGLLVREVERIQSWYFGKFPGIPKWQKDVRNSVESRRFVENAFGFRCYFLGRITEKTFKEAVAWIPQSTVANVIDHALVAITSNVPEVELLNQVHDSLVGQFPSELEEEILKKIKDNSQIVVPYSKPLIIPMGVKTSKISWGDC